MSALKAVAAGAFPFEPIRRSARTRLALRPLDLVAAAVALGLPLGFVAPAPGGVTMPLPEVALAVVAAAWAAVLLRRRERPRFGAGGAALAFVGLAALAGAAGPGERAGRLHAAALWLGLAVLYALCVRLGRGGVALLFGALAVSALVETMLALHDYAATRSERTAQLGGAIVSDRPHGTLGHPNALALFLVLALLPPLAYALLGRGRWRPAAAAAAVFAAAGVGLTYSREGLLVVGITALALAACAGRRKAAWVAATLAGLGAAAAAADAPFRDRLAATVSWSQLDPGGFRVTLWTRSLHELALHPLTGVGHFREVALFGRVPTVATHPHELWLGLAVLYGIPAAVAFAAVVWIGLRDGVAAARRRKPDATTAAGVIAALAALLLVGIVDYPFWNETLAVEVVLLVAAAGALRRVDERPLLSAPPLPRRTRDRRLGVVVVARNAGDDLHACLESVSRYGGVEGRDVVIVDNGSSDCSVEKALAAMPGAVVLRNRSNLGVARGRNRGIAASGARYLLMLDADAQLTEGAVDTLCARLDAEPLLALVGPRLEYPGGRLQESARAFPRVRSLVFGRPPLSRLLGEHWTVREHRLADWSHDAPAEVDYVLGACQLVRAEALADVGIYDEQIFYGPEDADLCLRLHRQGWRILYEPAARVVHRYRRMTVKAPLSRQSRALVAGWARVLVRHRWAAAGRRVPT